jgi:hypothetical protein
VYSDPKENAIYQLYSIDSSSAGSDTEAGKFKILDYKFITASGLTSVVTDLAMFDLNDFVAVLDYSNIILLDISDFFT